jgi:hypothetical protein
MVYESNPHTIEELKDNISHAVAAIKITILHWVYLNMISRAQLCIDAGGNRFQHLLCWFILSAFGYYINFCIYAMQRTRATFSWPILYKAYRNHLLEVSEFYLICSNHCLFNDFCLCLFLPLFFFAVVIDSQATSASVLCERGP